MTKREQLLAAAPDLLAALTQLTADYEARVKHINVIVGASVGDNDIDAPTVLIQARAAIDKATNQ